MADNPLLSSAFRLPFHEIRPADVEPAIDEALCRAREKLDALIAQKTRTFENTLLALEELQELVGNPFGIVEHLVSVRSSDELRAAHNAVEEKVTAFFTELVLSAPLWHAVKEFAQSQEARALTGEKQRFLKKVMEEFEAEGAELDDAHKERLRALNTELSQVTTRFAENVLDATAAFEHLVEDPKRLQGLPQSAIDAAKASARAKGLGSDEKPVYRFTLQMPSYQPVVTFAKDATLREKLYRARYGLAAGENRPLIAQILKLRAEKARLLGKANFADHALAQRMAKTGETAMRFVADLSERTRAFFEKENLELEAYRAAHSGEAGPLAPWDVAYWAERQREALYAFDEEELRPYFPLPRVLEGLFSIVHRLYGLTVTKTPAREVWHEDVTLFEVRDAKGVHLGSFYADFHPRDDKRGGAWMNSFITGGPRGGKHEPHLGLICANLTPPLGDKPALLTHAEVETVFHEFGHLLHHVTSRVPIKSLAGTRVAWDFVELPSQFMENFCWEREALDLFARHHETGETIPEPLFRKMIAARNYRSASAMMRQLAFASVDLALHVAYDPARDLDLDVYANRIMAAYQATPPLEGSSFISSFTHLFGSPVGYAAGYYSYKWAEVLDAHAFRVFRERGIFDPDVGRDFLDKLLSQGDARDPLELFVGFAGRAPELDALLERSGLTR